MNQLAYLAGVVSLAIGAMAPIAQANNGQFINSASSNSSNVANKMDAGKMNYYGGPVISNVKVYTVLWGDKVNPTIAAAMPGFYASMVNSTYMDFLTVYNTTSVASQSGQGGSNQTIGRGTYAQTLTLNLDQSIMGLNSVDDTQIQAELERQALAGLIPSPDNNSLYMVHFPPGLTITGDDGKGGKASSCEQFCAFHNGFVTKSGANMFYGVIPDLDSPACQFGCGVGSSMDRITVSASHEVMEAITDPFPTPGSTPGYPQAWNTTDGMETGDLCQSNIAKLTGRTAKFKIQQIFDNSKNACTNTPTYTSAI